MINQKLESGHHKWNKINLVTQFDRKGSYDDFKCECGLTGRSRQLGMISIHSRSVKKAARCPLYAPKDEQGGERIRITRCNATNPAFANCTPGSEHVLIEPPKDRTNRNEYWVQGVGEPVRLWEDEFTFIK